MDYFPYIGNFIIPTDEPIFFRGVGQPPIRNGKLNHTFLDLQNSRSSDIDECFLVSKPIELPGLVSFSIELTLIILEGGDRWNPPKTGHLR